jgi:hypothetical protein
MNHDEKNAAKTHEWIKEQRTRLNQDDRLLNEIKKLADAAKDPHLYPEQAGLLGNDDELRTLFRTAHARRSAEAREKGYHAPDLELEGIEIQPFTVTIHQNAEGTLYVNGSGLGLGEMLINETALADATIKNAVIKKPEPGYEFNAPERLATVGCDLIIKLPAGTKMGEDVVLTNERITPAFRTSYLTDKNGEMEYRLPDNSLIHGRFPWTYP